MRLILLFMLSHLIIAPALEGTLSGSVKVINTATMRAGMHVVRLSGIAAPQPAGQCRLPCQTIPCGLVAMTALMDLTADAETVCQTHGDPHDFPRAGSITLATCTAGSYDLSEGMIYTGWERPNNIATNRYRNVEAGARNRIPCQHQQGRRQPLTRTTTLPMACPDSMRAWAPATFSSA